VGHEAVSCGSGGIGVSAGSAASRRIVFIPVAEFHDIGGEHRVRNGAQLAAARLLYGMGRNDALPKSFFGKITTRSRIPANNVILHWRNCAGWIFPAHLRARSGIAEFRGVHRVYGRECSGFCALLLARREENGVEFLVAYAGFRDLRLHLVEPEHAKRKRWARSGPPWALFTVRGKLQASARP